MVVLLPLSAAAAALPAAAAASAPCAAAAVSTWRSAALLAPPVAVGVRVAVLLAGPGLAAPGGLGPANGGNKIIRQSIFLPAEQ